MIRVVMQGFNDELEKIAKQLSIIKGVGRKYMPKMTSNDATGMLNNLNRQKKIKKLEQIRRRKASTEEIGKSVPYPVNLK